LAYFITLISDSAKAAPKKSPLATLTSPAHTHCLPVRLRGTFNHGVLYSESKNAAACNVSKAAASYLLKILPMGLAMNMIVKQEMIILSNKFDAAHASRTSYSSTLLVGMLMIIL
jgi:hypothetical protein